MKTINFNRKRKAAYLPIILISSVLFIAMAYAIISIAMSNVKMFHHHESMVSALDIADAGINYYMWHLSHENKDYCDGNPCPPEPPYGPYTHEFQDKDGQVVGSFDLIITPPVVGEKIVHINSVGKIAGESLSRSVIADVGMPSFARYAFLANTECWFGSNETTNGPVHSNTGVHFDGTANGMVSASLATYKPGAPFGGDGQFHNGVWGNGGPTGFWVFPVPAINFNQVSVDLNKLKTDAAAKGISLDSSDNLGYYLNLKSNNKIDVYRVTKEKSSGITTTFIQTYDPPSNGLIYAADNIWVDGTYGGQITIAAQSKSGPDAIIKIKDNLLYSARDGTAKIGLVAVGNIEVPRYAPDDLEIDAALLSQKGHVWFPYVKEVIKNSISIYGSISTFDYWTWTWVSGSSVTSGYRYTSQTYDNYLTLDPPPGYPTTGSYNILTWREE